MADKKIVYLESLAYNSGDDNVYTYTSSDGWKQFVYDKPGCVNPGEFLKVSDYQANMNNLKTLINQDIKNISDRIDQIKVNPDEIDNIVTDKIDNSIMTDDDFDSFMSDLFEE